MTVIMLACLGAACAPADDGPGVASRLRADSSDEEIMLHMLAAADGQRQTGELARHFPDLGRKRAYAIQRLRLEHGRESDRHVGWKLGWTRLAGAEDELDPIVGHYFSKRVFAEGEPVSTRFFTDGIANAEPEIVFYLKHDLPGPAASREEVIAAVDSVGVAMEFVNWRATEPRTREHAVVDNGIASGVVLGEARFALEDVDFSAETGRVVVNGRESSEGPATSIMGEDPLSALIWAANELPKWGMELKAGDFVLSGTVCPPLPVQSGDSATVSFTSLGSVSAEFVD